MHPTADCLSPVSEAFICHQEAYHPNNWNLDSLQACHRGQPKSSHQKPHPGSPHASQFWSDFKGSVPLSSLLPHEPFFLWHFLISRLSPFPWVNHTRKARDTRPKVYRNSEKEAISDIKRCQNQTITKDRWKLPNIPYLRHQICSQTSYIDHTTDNCVWFISSLEFSRHQGQI